MELENMFGILGDSLQRFYNFNTMGNMLVKKETLKAGKWMHNVLQNSRQELTGKVWIWTWKKGGKENQIARDGVE